MSSTELVGGLRARLIFDSVFNAVKGGLTTLNWIGGAGQRGYQTIRLVAGEQDVYSEIPINTMALSDENISSLPWEVGSHMTEDTRYFYLDFFGESDALSRHVMGDMRDMLLGKLPQTGLTGPEVSVYDYRQNPATELFSMDLVGVRLDRSHEAGRPWLRHWYSIQFQAVDYGPSTGVPS